MNIFLRATRMKLRWITTHGLLTVEDLWDLNLASLNKIAMALAKEIKACGEESFLETESKVPTVLKLQFDIVLEIMDVKKNAAKEAEQRLEKKRDRDKLLALLERKQDQELENKSAEDIQKMLEEL